MVVVVVLLSVVAGVVTVVLVVPVEVGVVTVVLVVPVGVGVVTVVLTESAYMAGKLDNVKANTKSLIKLETFIAHPLGIFMLLYVYFIPNR